jgi:hypothetical protein
LNRNNQRAAFGFASIMASLAAACQVVTGLAKLEEKTDPTLGPVAEDGSSREGGVPIDDAASVDVRGLSDIDVPAGSYLLHVTTEIAHVVSDPPAIDCWTNVDSGADSGVGTRCAVALPAETRLVLTASASSLFQFDGWGGACQASTTQQCAVVMDSDKEVSVYFSRAR